MSRSGNFNPSIRFTVVSVFAFATALTAALAIGLQFYFGHVLAKETARTLYTLASQSVATEMRGIRDRNTSIIELLSENPVLARGNDEALQRKVFSSVLENNPLYYGMYLGHGDGSFFELINLHTSEVARKSMRALPTDRWLVVRISGEGEDRRRYFSYYDDNFKLRLARSEPTDYEVDTRPWYNGAMASAGAHRSEPYLFAQLGHAGETVSRRVGRSDTVIGMDMTLRSISDLLARQQVADFGEIFLYNEEGEIIASSAYSEDSSGKPSVSRLTMVSEASASMTSRVNLRDQLIEAREDGQTYFVYGTRLGSAGERPSFFGVRVPEAAIVGPFMEKIMWSIGITAGFLLLLLPLSWVFAGPIVRPIKQLALQNDKVRDRMYDEVQQVTSNIKELDELSVSMVEMVGAIRSYEQAQRELMDSFIQLIAQAIDDKSAYTGGHCNRVPVLALMLAEEASTSEIPAFSSFRLETDDQWREYKIAAWLHDCGKITTPEHIVDKGSKLEAIYNRIHEVRMRFEVLHRDAEIDYWEQLCKHPEQRDALTVQLKSRQATLQDDYTFVANCNVGGEFMDPQKQERLSSLGEAVWHRYFDDRLGLSPVEELRLEGQAEALPARELLLADKPVHIIPRTSSTDYPPEMGINMDVPKHLYNLGELYNLSISRGTLTAEDRFKINEHMISTIKMLGSLPFPPELQNVPRYASTHHETMRGSGYPRKLSGEQLSIPERILAVADIFEALTASDRPYKKAKPVSVALSILHKMMLDNHVDKDCFELFVRSGVYIKYAEEFLQTEQIDRVDIKEYLS
jgi:HD-GYP domain-containing protein (c-di-GMP phosphodiesterase class II)